MDFTFVILLSVKMFMIENGEQFPLGSTTTYKSVLTSVSNRLVVTGAMTQQMSILSLIL